MGPLFEAQLTEAGTSLSMLTEDMRSLGADTDALAGLGFHTGLWTEGALNRINWEVGHAGSRVQKIDVAWSGPAYQHALECNKVAAEGIERNADARAFVWTVQGWAGTQRYGICWTGDQYGNWDLIRYHIPTLITSGMSGQAYATTDVDGIFGGSPETYTRDLQWKCFTPAIYVMNGWSHMPKSPWNYEEPYRSINRDYLKLKNVQLGYTLPEKITRKFFVQQLRFFVSGENLLTITGFPGLDPEIGAEVGYPLMRQVTFGAQITF